MDIQFLFSFELIILCSDNFDRVLARLLILWTPWQCKAFNQQQELVAMQNGRIGGSGSTTMAHGKT